MMEVPVIERIALVTDFGAGPYLGQMQAALDASLPDHAVIDLVHDLPPFRPDLAAYLLPALARDMPPRTLYLCVVDPGVGGARDGVIARVGEDWFVAPDNGLLAPHLMAGAGQCWRIGWLPSRRSATFHGRDWFLPVAARLCRGEDVGATRLDRPVGHDWPKTLDRVLYADHYGNLMTGLRPVGHAQSLRVGERLLPWARTFCAVEPGEAFWYENALGLVEIAVNQGRADGALGLVPGDPVGPFIMPG
ncbi:hypothetical protein CKO17_06090 [Marichromatium gracile]|nr:hypothetical protein [Marichromatium gracile]